MAKIKVCENNVSKSKSQKEWKWAGVSKMENEESMVKSKSYV